MVSNIVNTLSVAVLLLFITATTHSQEFSNEVLVECRYELDYCQQTEECAYMFTFPPGSTESCIAGQQTVMNLEGLESMLEFIATYQAQLRARMEIQTAEFDKWRVLLNNLQIRWKIERGDFGSLSGLYVDGFEYSIGDLRRIVLYQHRILRELGGALEEINVELEDCETLEAPVGGTLSTTEVKSGTSVSVTCAAGYTLSGTEILCTNGAWSDALATCVPDDCDILDSPRGGELSTLDISSGVSLSLLCDDGYTVRGEATISCLAGKWSAELGTCDPDKCDALEAPLGGSLSTLDVSSGTQVTVTCDEGFTISGRPTISCSYGKWSGAVAECFPDDCVALSAPDGGSLSNQFEFSGVSVTVECDEGYAMKGEATISCFAGKWSDELATCVPDDCDPLEAPTGGSISTTEVSTGTVVEVNCDEGHARSGRATITCFFGKWNADVAKCLPDDCQPLQAPHGGSLSTREISSGTVVTVTCAEGHNLVGKETVTCTAGKWSDKPAECVAERCEPLESPENGELSTTDLDSGTKVTVICDDGFSLNGKATITCSHGMWTGEVATCKPDDCETLEAIEFGTLSSVEVGDGTIVTLTCDEGYALRGEATITCGAGKWSAELGICVSVSCEALSVPLGGVLSTTDVKDGTSVTVSCHEGYVISGEATIECINGSWTKEVALCVQVSIDITLRRLEVLTEGYEDIFYDVGSLKKYLFVKTNSHVHVLNACDGKVTEADRVSVTPNFGGVESCVFDDRNILVASGKTDALVFEWTGQELKSLQTIDNSPYYTRDFACIEALMGSDVKQFLFVSRFSNVDQPSDNSVESVIYEWDGEKFELFQTIPLFSSTDGEFMMLDGDLYLHGTESFYDTPSKIFKLNKAMSSFDQYQTLPIRGSAFSVSKFTTEAGKTYIVEPLYWNSAGLTGSTTEVYSWNRGSAQVEKEQTINIPKAWRTCPFSVGGKQYLVTMSKGQDPVIYRLEGGTFVEHEVITNAVQPGDNTVRSCSVIEGDGKTCLMLHKTLYEISGGAGFTGDELTSER